MGINSLIESHRRNHGCITQRLELHVAACFSALQFDHNQVPLFIKAQQVDSPVGTIPAPILFSKNHRLWRNYLYTFPDDSLYMITLSDSMVRECRLRHLTNTILAKLVNGHFIPS